MVDLIECALLNIGSDYFPISVCGSCMFIVCIVGNSLYYMKLCTCTCLFLSSGSACFVWSLYCVCVHIMA